MIILIFQTRQMNQKKRLEIKMEFLTKLFLFYSFFTFYFLFIFILIYLQRRKEIFNYPPLKKSLSLSIVVPCYNGEEAIASTISHLINLDYDKLEKIIIVDDCSTDNSYKIAKEFEKKDKRVLVVQTPKNTGNAAGAKNYGAQFVETELIGFTDDDSFPLKDSIKKMMGFFENSKVAVVTPSIYVQTRNTFLEKFQSIEYKVIAFTRKLLGFIDSIYVTPGPLALYRKKVFDEVGGFDPKNLTEDIEITWHIVSKGYKVEMCVPAKAYTVAPKTIGGWFNQRVRWNLGGIQTLVKYFKSFFKCGMLGTFIIPFFTFSWILAIFGFFILVYRFVRIFIIRFLSTKYSLEAQAAILTLNDINLTPSVLTLFGFVLLFLSIVFTFLALIYTREKEFKSQGILSILGYMFFYLLSRPAIMLVSLYKYVKKDMTW